MKRIVICGGHLTPALALIDELKKEKDIEIIFFGRKFATEGSENTSAEFTEIKSQNIKFVNIPAGRFNRKITKLSLIAITKIPLGFILSFLLLLKYRPKLIVSFGGYLSLPIVFCGWLLGIDSICHEQATVAGLANKINAFFAQKIFVSWPETQKLFPPEKTEIIGNLTRKSILELEAKNDKLAKFLKNSKNLIFVTGGNQGSHFINQLIFKNISKLKDFEIIHQIGTANYNSDHERAALVKSQNYFYCDFIDSKNIGAVFNKASFIISRSGANTIWDLAFLGKSAILIPLPHAASSEQEKNAKILQIAKSAIIVSQKDLTAKNLPQVIKNFAADLKTYQKNARFFKKILPRDAAFKLRKAVLSYT